MEAPSDHSYSKCHNCGASVKGPYCHECGQHVRDNSDRSLGRLLGEFLDNIFIFDSRFVISLRYLFQYPGRMTVEFLDGKRRKFMSPISLFLFLNVIYFVVNPVTDYSITLVDQLYFQPYSEWVNEWATLQLEERETNIESFGSVYQKASDDISKSIMFLNIPLFALVVYIISFKRRPFFFDSLIFSTHFFSLFITSLVMLEGAANIVALFDANEDSVLVGVLFFTFTTIGPILYAIFGIGHFLKLSWYWAIPAGIGVFAGVLFANFIYRPIIFFLVFLTV